MSLPKRPYPVWLADCGSHKRPRPNYLAPSDKFSAVVLTRPVLLSCGCITRNLSHYVYTGEHFTFTYSAKAGGSFTKVARS